MARGFSSAQPHLNIVLLGAAIGIAVGARQGWLGALAGALLGPVAAYAVLGVLFALFYGWYRLRQGKPPGQTPNKVPTTALHQLPFAERFQILDTLPADGLTQDAVAVQPQLQRRVIVRTLLEHRNRTAAEIEAFLGPYQAMMLLGDSVRVVYDCIHDDMRCCVILECLDDGPLLDQPSADPGEQDRLEVSRNYNGLPQAAEIADLAHALHEAHRRNLVACIPGFPDTIQVQGGGKPKWALLAARSNRPPSVPTDDRKHYWSPECRRGHPVDERGDIYALGAVFFQHLTGQHPAHAGKAHQHTATDAFQLPEFLGRYQPVIDKMLAAEPAERYQSAVEAGAEIQAINDRHLRDHGPVY